MLRKVIGVVSVLMILAMAMATTPVFAASGNTSVTVSSVQAATTFVISGTITDGTTGIAGVTVRFGKFATKTASDGTYTISGVANNTKGTLMPILKGYAFTPASMALTVTADQTGKDFVGTKVFTLAGHIMLNGKGLKGVKLTLGSMTTMTLSNGSFLFTSVPEGTTGSLVPSLSGYTFTPASLPIAAVTGNLTAQNFTAAVQTKTISGTITGLGTTDTVQVYYGIKSNQVVTTEAGTGKFSIPDLPANVPYVLLPYSTAYVFTPQHLIIPAGPNDVTDANFVATPAVTMSGKVTVNGKPVKGVTIHVGDLSEVTDAKGAYSMLVPAGTDLTVTATHSLFTFAPESVSAQTANFTQDFDTATVTVTGKVTEFPGGAPVEGVTISASTTASTTTKADGTYSMSVTSADVKNLASFSVKATLAGWKFKPGVQPVNLGKGASGKNFIGTRLGFSVTGHVTTSDGKGVGGAIITFGKFKAVSNSSGLYTLKGIPFGSNVTLSIIKYGYTFSTVAPFTMPAQNMTTGADFTATPMGTGTQISGTITLGQGTSTPLAGVKVVLMWQTLTIKTATTDSNGAYTFGNLFAGDGYSVQPFKANYAFLPAGAVIVSTKTANATVNFSASHVAIVKGVIKGVAAGTQVTITATGTGSNVVTKTITLDKTGHFILPALTDDTYTLTVTATGYTFAPVTITITPTISSFTVTFTGTKS